MPLSKLSAAEQTAYLRSLLDSMIEGVVAVDTQGVATLCNAAFVRLLGFDSTSAVIGLPVLDLLCPEGAHGDCPILRVARTGIGEQIPHAVFRQRNGDRLNVEYNAQPVFEAGALTGAICTFSDIGDRLRTEQALSETHAQLKVAQFAGGVIAAWVWDIATNTTSGGDTFADAFGLDRDAARQGVDFSEAAKAVHPGDLVRVQEEITNSLQSGAAVCRVEYRLMRHDGSHIWVECIGSIERDEAGTPVRVPTLLIDIDERRRTGQALKETHEQLQRAQKAGGVGVFTIPAESDILTVSGQFCDIFGIPFAETVSLSATAKLVLDEDNDARSTVADRASGTTPMEAEYRIRRPSDGEIRWVHRRAEFMRDEDGKALYMVGTVQDVTERKAAALRLKESQDYLKLVFDSIQDHAIIALDAAGKVMLWNSGAEEIFGYAPEEVVGQPGDLIFTPEDHAASVPQEELLTAAIHGRARDERWHLRKNGDRFYASGTMAAMYDETGAVTGFIKIARDMTLQQQAQEALMEARNAAEAANIAKTEFLANMSHEIRTPMNAIIGLSAILAGSSPLSPRQTEFIKTLQTSADTLLALINDLLDIAKIEARSVELEHIPFSLTRMMQEITSMMAVQVREKGLTFTGEGRSIEGRTFIGDPTRLRQIIVNLCSNAIKFTEIGNVHFSISCHPVDGESQIETVCISVRDSGIGIPAEKLDTIFHKFVQADTSINRKYGGTGLGLAITKTLTEVMGGTIAVDSELGKGSTFTVCVPLEVAGGLAVTVEKALATSAAPATGGPLPRVLLVEDYEPNVLVASTFLEEFGYEVDVASNGFEAFEKIKAQSYVTVLMDVQMHGMNGLDATRAIREYEVRENRPPARIVGMTAHALAGDRERCLSVGMDDYIAKPFHPEDLRKKIEAGQI